MVLTERGSQFTRLVLLETTPARPAVRVLLRLWRVDHSETEDDAGVGRVVVLDAVVEAIVKGEQPA